MILKTPVSSGWFRIAVQALVMIAESKEPCSSATIAQDVEAHAVFLRRVLAQLVRAGIVQAREGRAGGYRLSRDATHISLAEVYQAVKLANPPDEVSSRDCANARVQAVLDEVSSEAERHALEVLEHHTLAAVIERAGQLSPTSSCASSASKVR